MLHKSVTTMLLATATYVCGYFAGAGPIAAQRAVGPKSAIGLPPLAPDQPQRATHWSNEALQAAHAKMAARAIQNPRDPRLSLAELQQLVPLPYTRTHVFNLMHRGAQTGGQALGGESHDGVTDIYFVVAGGGTVTVGGEIEGRKDPASPSDQWRPAFSGGEYRGPIKGGEVFKLKAGDILSIPPNLPHATNADPGGMTYMMLKINVGLYPWSNVALLQ